MCYTKNIPTMLILHKANDTQYSLLGLKIMDSRSPVMMTGQIFFSPDKPDSGQSNDEYCNFFFCLRNIELHWQQIVFTTLTFTLCGSRKYPYPPPPHGRSLEIPRGRGVHGKLLFHEQNIESNIQSIVSTKTYVHCFQTKISTPGH